MRLAHAPILAVLAACSIQDVGVSSGKARFSEYPEALFMAFESACADPAQTFKRRSRELVECREYLPPPQTAAIILAYDGTHEDLPQLVFRFRTRRETAGYLVENDIYLDIPQKQGDPRLVAQSDPAFQRLLDDLYVRSGGTPEPN